MAPVWTNEKLAALSPVQLEQLKRNALAKGESNLAEMCADIQDARKPKRVSGTPSKEPVVGFHFVCKDDYEVILGRDGTFQSGVWAIDDKLCDPAIALGGYVALHNSKDELSYRQGKIVGWRNKERTKGKTLSGVEFQLVPLDTPIRWYGAGAGERGYRRTIDEPSWQG